MATEIKATIQLEIIVSTDSDNNKVYTEVNFIPKGETEDIVFGFCSALAKSEGLTQLISDSVEMLPIYLDSEKEFNN